MSESQNTQGKTKESQKSKKMQRQRQCLQKRLKKAQASLERAEERLRMIHLKIERKRERVAMIDRKLSLLEDKLRERNINMQSYQTYVIPTPLGQTVESENCVDTDETRVIATLTEDAVREAVARSFKTEIPLNASSHETTPTQLEGKPVRKDVPLVKQHSLLYFAKDRITVSIVEGYHMNNDQSNLSKQQLSHEQEEDIAALDEDEREVASLAAMIIADAAAEEAAKAEAMAESLSRQTREAKEQFDHAQEELQKVQKAIEQRELTGEEASQKLQQVEQRVALARTCWQEASQAEQSALQKAIDTEAEAEVTQGMSISSQEHV